MEVKRHLSSLPTGKQLHAHVVLFSIMYRQTSLQTGHILSILP